MRGGAGREQAPPLAHARAFLLPAALLACRLRSTCHCMSLRYATCRAGGGRFFKSALCVHDDGGLVVVKVRSGGMRRCREVTLLPSLPLPANPAR